MDKDVDRLDWKFDPLSRTVKNQLYFLPAFAQNCNQHSTQDLEICVCVCVCVCVLLYLFWSVMEGDHMPPITPSNH